MGISRNSIFNACHSERSEESPYKSGKNEILRCAQNDNRAISRSALMRLGAYCSTNNHLFLSFLFDIK